MNIVLNLFGAFPYLILFFIFLFIYFFIYIVLYVYVNFNIKGISYIMFNDEERYGAPLEPFSFFFISMLPTVFWREVLNIKFNKPFKKLYGKEFYYKINSDQLKNLLDKYPKFFKIQYMAVLSILIGMFFLFLDFISTKYF
ncbi:hypothetical protein I5523_17405 [Acinetobacter oleivorans]|uniref:hypothetical protein n=1 Tax=Acinetobacter oleivorans TaxID=1148157 RepID=UPI0019014106|nr:hypothetical protein [Acinetobacter oleivorans]MBJ9741410.1 hypothetical protein [Acinetobacter oleivorans]MCU4411094.1 hypothetical protein [Acinetobacter oleivorans]